MADPRPLILIVSGPAGVGKTTVCDRLAESHAPRLTRAITATTRLPREGEVDGVDYHFFSRDDFLARRDAGGFFEWAQVHDRFYGTPKAEIIALLEADKDVLLNIDVQGAESFRKAAAEMPDLPGRVVTVFIAPGGETEAEQLEVLRQRMIGRGLNDSADIERRLRTARKELREALKFDHILHSADKEADFARACEIYRVEQAVE